MLKDRNDLYSKTLGQDYIEDTIKERIAGKVRITKKPKRQSKFINLLIDIQNNIKAQQSKGYEHWAKINNLKQVSKTLNFLTEHNVTDYEQLTDTISKI